MKAQPVSQPPSSLISVEGAAEEALSQMTPKEKRKARRLLDVAKNLPTSSVNVVKSDGSVKTWRELGFDIDAPPETPGIYYSEKKSKGLFERSQKAQSLEKEGKIEEAIALYKQNVSAKSDLPIDYERLSMIYNKRKDFEIAIKYCDLALESPACTNPAQDTARRNFGGRRDKLIEKLTALEEKNTSK